MVMVQIRNMPDEVHRRLKARAAASGMTLSDYLLVMARREVERPTMDELLERVRARGPVLTDVDPVDALREEREAR